MHDNKLAPLYREALKRKGLSGNQLSKLSGVAEATIRKLLNEELDPIRDAFHPLVLKATSEALDLDTNYVFQVAGYADPKPSAFDLSVQADYFAYRFSRLPADKQTLLWEMLESLERASGITTPGEHAAQLIRAVDELRQIHPMFRERTFGLKEEFGRLMGNLTRTTTQDLMLDQFLVPRLRDVLMTEQMQPLTRSEVERVLEHPDVALALNILLPRKDMPTALEKLFWLAHPAGTLDQHTPQLSAEHQAGIRALWKLLAQLAQSSGADAVQKP